MATITHKKKRTASSARNRKASARIANLKKLGTEAKLPSTVPPMLATLVDNPFDAENWLFEVKWDGYRAIAICDKNKVSLISRNNKSFNEKFYPITAALQQLKLHAVLDGEIIISNKEGISSFGDLQNWRSEADGDLLYYVFDLLWLNGRQLYEVPLQLRRELLKEILPVNSVVQFSQTFNASGTSFFEVAKEMNMEGIIAKKADSLYTPGVRTKDWLKIKIAKRQEVVIGGYTLNEGSTKLFSSLLVGVFENGQLHYTGKIGTGFTDKVQRDMMQQFKSLVQKGCPFENEPDYNKPSRFRPNPPKATATWLKPELVCEVSFAEITSDGVMRHPSFEGMRIDKKAKEVIADKAKPTKKVVKESILHKEKIITRRQPGERKTLLNPGEKQQERSINGYTLKFSNLDKIYWPKEKITKRDMLNYYYQVAPVILPYLKDRPQSLNRYPNGIEGESFYQKNVLGKIPSWIDTFPYTSEGIKKSFMVPTREADVLYMASLGCIEMNPWSSTVKKPDNPDWCIIDLDPDTNTFEQVIKTAQVTHEVLDSAGIDNYCKTSGSTGIHIYIPLGAKYVYEDSREFGRLIATIIHEQIPRFTSIERATADRKGKLYIDFLQNRPQATLACAYSLRPKPGATVSMPLHWEEVKKGLKMKDFNIRNAVGRIKEQGDIFKPVLGKGINMKKAIGSLEKIFR
jgi:bifunctional non-homologous end joining protein LigD